MAFLTTALSTKAPRILARQSRAIFTLTSIAALVIVTLVYLAPHQIDDSVRTSWDYNMPQHWTWNNLLSEERWSMLRGDSVQDVEEDPQHVWDTVCHEAVEKGLKVALYDFTPFHDEVVGSIMASLNDTGVQTDLYRRAFRYGYTDILENFFPTQEPEAMYYQHELMPRLKAGEYDALIMTSCDEWWIQPELLELLPTLSDVSVMCLHHEMYSFNAHRSRLLNVAKAGKLTFLTLGDHVTKLVKEENLGPWTMDGEDDGFQWNNVPTESFVPIFPLPESIPLPSLATEKIIPNDVAILGDINNWGRRDYPRLWADLMSAIQENPSAWGYTISPEDGYFVPSTAATNVQPFRVHIFGARLEGTIIPEELLQHVIVFHSGLDYVDYYRELSKLDLILPILGTKEYTRNRATAAFPAGIISRIPSLVTPSLLKSYSYLEPPAIVLHPEGTGEIQVVAAMRRGEDPWTGVALPESELAPPSRSRCTHSPLLDRHLPQRRNSPHREADWEGYVADVGAYNANLLCKALLR